MSGLGKIHYFTVVSFFFYSSENSKVTSRKHAQNGRFVQKFPILGENGHKCKSLLQRNVI